MITKTYFTGTDIYGTNYSLYAYVSDVTGKTYYVFEVKNDTDHDADASFDSENFDEAKDAMIAYIAENPFNMI